jgi:hypothetical protein
VCSRRWCRRRSRPTGSLGALNCSIAERPQRQALAQGIGSSEQRFGVDRAGFDRSSETVEHFTIETPPILRRGTAQAP